MRASPGPTIDGPREKELAHPSDNRYGAALGGFSHRQIMRNAHWHRGGVGTFPQNTRKFEWDVGTRLAGHDTGLRGPRPTLPGVTAAWPKPSARQPRGRSISATQARSPWKPVPQSRRPAPPASTIRPCHLPEGARPPQRPVVRWQLLVRSSSPRRVREREAVTFGASPAQGTEPQVAPAS